METIGELVGRDRRTREPALRARRGVNLRYDYYQFCTTAHKTGNFFSHRGVRIGSSVGVVGEESGAPVLSLFGAALLGARVRFDPLRETDAELLVAPGAGIEGYDLPSGASRLAYDEAPAPGVEAFGESVWSENPWCPTPPEVGPDTPLLETDRDSYTHGELLAAADRVIERHELEAGDEVAIRAPLSHPGTVVAGVLAPLSVGGVIVFPESETAGEREPALAVGEGLESAVSPADVL